MKKGLLLSALGMMSMSAFALQDVTPANYLFNKVTEFKYHDQVYGTSNFGAPVWETLNGDTYFNEGMVALCGAKVGWGTDEVTPVSLMESVDGPHLVAGTSLVDLGGEVGQVLCISGVSSKINDRIKELYGVDMEIPNMTAGLHWFNINFFADPKTLNKDGGDDYFNVRCRITCNFFHNNITDGLSLVNPYLVGNQNNIKTTDNKICADEFIRLNEDETPVDDNGDESEVYFWDPNKWMQFEVNMEIQEDEKGLSYSPVRLKYDVKADPMQAGTMFIRSVEFFVPTKDEAVNNSLPVKNYITLKADPGKPGSTGIGSIATDNAQASVSLNGNVATFTGAATVFNLAGAKVASVAANQGVALAAGAYIANVEGKSVKFFVK